jgi:hypothetical protein
MHAASANNPDATADALPDPVSMLATTIAPADAPRSLLKHIEAVLKSEQNPSKDHSLAPTASHSRSPSGWVW